MINFQFHMIMWALCMIMTRLVCLEWRTSDDGRNSLGEFIFYWTLPLIWLVLAILDKVAS